MREVSVIESTIPEDMTISDYRRARHSRDERNFMAVVKIGLALEVLALVQGVRFYHRHPTGESPLTHLNHRY